MTEIISKEISPKKHLRRVSTICAYWGISLDESIKTIDHIVPKVGGRNNNISNIVFCCPKCNVLKGKLDIKAFLLQYNRLTYFENYLKITDFKINDSSYSEMIRNKIENSKYICTQPGDTGKAERKNEEYCCYYKFTNGITVAITPTQSKILDYFLEYKHIQDRKALSDLIGISNTELSYHISCINNLTGLLPLSKVSENGIKFNRIFFLKNR